MSERKYPKSQQDALDASKKLFDTLIDAAKNKKTIKLTKTEDDLDSSFEQDSCPFNECDGSGYNLIEKNGSFFSVDCTCYKEEVLKRKLSASKIQASYWDATIESLSAIDDKISLTLLKPLEKQGERKIDKRKKTVEPESPPEYIARTYEQKPYPHSISLFAKYYIENVFKLLEQRPRKNTVNLMLLGDSGKGKTHFASAIGKEFLKNDKTVHFTRMRTLLDMSFDQKDEVMRIVKNVDLLIIDELAQEYHTDSKWALKQIQDIIKERQETGLPIICTTNAYPNELEIYYESSLMSTFNGRFVMTVFHGDLDLRNLDARKMYDNLDFLNF